MTDKIAPATTLPRSDVLAEVSPDSLSEAIARFDAAISAGTHDGVEAKRDLRTIIIGMRAQRERWEKLEASGTVKIGGKAPLGRKIVGKSAEDLGL